MVRLYTVVGSLICLFFVYACMNAMRILDFGGVSAARPVGSALYHK
jgi:hypothetical protein